MARKAVTIKAAWITGIFVVVAGVIAGLFGLCARPTDRTNETTVGHTDESLIFTGGSHNFTINYNVPPTETKTAIEALEKKLDGANKEISLNRQEIQAITSALKDLDERTAGIEKLPDGRTRLGSVVMGYPRVVVQEHNAAAGLFKKNRFTEALDHSKLAVEAYEACEQVKGAKFGELKQSDVATIYYVGAMSAHRLKKHDLAYKWAERANTLESNTDRVALLAVTLFNVNRPTEALDVVDQRLKDDPNNRPLENVKSELTKRVGEVRNSSLE